MILNKKAVLELAAQDTRLDGRGFTDYRSPITVETNISWTAEGSAKVQIGKTVVMAGVKMSLEKPYADTADQGGIMINAELLPLSSSDYEPGPPQMKAIELARVTDRGIRESGAIDLKKLCIEPGVKSWFVIIDLMSINDDGNLSEAASLAALAALKSARFPVVNEDGTIDYKKKTDEPLPIMKEPISITVYKVGGKLLVDPTAEEEKAYNARLTIASDAKGIISAMQKGGSTPLTIDEVGRMADIALEKANFLREKLNAALGGQ